MLCHFHCIDVLFMIISALFFVLVSDGTYKAGVNLKTPLPRPLGLHLLLLLPLLKNQKPSTNISSRTSNLPTFLQTTMLTKVYCERSIDLDSLCDTSVATEIKRRGWVSMCHNGHPTHIPNSCIPKFYSNFLNIELKNNEFDVYFRKKKKYHISPDVVSTAFKLPRVCNPEYHFSPKSTTTDDAMISHFCGKPMT
jgi:hypothetical protein